MANNVKKNNEGWTCTLLRLLAYCCQIIVTCLILAFLEKEAIVKIAKLQLFLLVSDFEEVINFKT